MKINVFTLFVPLANFLESDYVFYEKNQIARTIWIMKTTQIL